ncbi:MAG: site-2 protease family protein [Rhodospirillales bacterium]|nr:site-2 protease family protein [Rhodospirillales bacterium]
MGDFADIGMKISVWALPVLLAVTLHEAAHGWAAWKLGDDTAKRMGRVTFNPLKHVDPFGTVLLPILLLIGSGGQMMFGFAKPVPVNFWNLRNPRRDMVLVALAGPGTNLLLAIAAASIFHLGFLIPDSVAPWLALNLKNAMIINVVLCIFNMLPLPPLDGGRVAVGLLPHFLAEPLSRLERAGMFIILFMLFILPWIGNQIGYDLNIFYWLVWEPALYVLDGIIYMLGIGR